jgi:hypothetical protein
VQVVLRSELQNKLKSVKVNVTVFMTPVEQSTVELVLSENEQAVGN